MKRVLLFLAVNAGVITTITIMTRLLGLEPYLNGG